MYTKMPMMLMITMMLLSPRGAMKSFIQTYLKKKTEVDSIQHYKNQKL